MEKGDTELINLTLATEISPVSLEEVYQKAKAKYKILYKDEWVCFSPEIFVKIEDNHIKTYPMKGTISATLPDAEALLLNNPKEIDEHKKSCRTPFEGLSTSSLGYRCKPIPLCRCNRKIHW